MTLDNYMNITYKNCEMKNKCTDVPADLVNMGRFWGRWGREKVREAKRVDSEERSFLSALFSVPPLPSKIFSPLTPKEGHTHFLNVRHF